MTTKYKSLDHRILSNIVRAAGKTSTVPRWKVFYSLPDLSAEVLDDVLKRYSIEAHDTRTGGKAYDVVDAVKALRKLEEDTHD